MDSPNLKSAIAYARRGWHTFPLHYPIVAADGEVVCSCRLGSGCSSTGKHPITPTGFTEATIDQVQLRNWWNEIPQANVGIATGKKSGFFVLDVDPRSGGNESLKRLTDANGPLPDTLTVNTGGNGLHFYFQCPDFKVPNSVGKNGWLKEPGLDIRGDGGLVVAPPSEHASGNRWEWLDYDAEILPPPKWLLLKIPRQQTHNHTPVNYHGSNGDTGRMWLGKALAEAGIGSRNEIGIKLACQLRDAGLSQSEAEGYLRDYASRVPQNGTPYREAEALASLRSAYSRPARPPAVSESRRNGNGYHGLRKASAPVVEPLTESGASAELSDNLERIISGEIYNVPWPWEQLTRMTQSLLPGSISVVCGDAGVGKTFFILQCLEFWNRSGHTARAMFIEKDRKFYTRRALAQIECNGSMVDLEWIQKHPDEVREAYGRHKEEIDRMGTFIHTPARGERVTLDSLMAWISQCCTDGVRVMVIDPITAAVAGQNRWEKDDDFMIGVQAELNKYGASLVLITHPTKMNQNVKMTGHNASGGAAYFRFCDSLVWPKRLKKAKDVRYLRSGFGITSGEIEYFFELMKTRDGRGAGKELAFTFGGDLLFHEQGIVIEGNEPA